MLSVSLFIITNLIQDLNVVSFFLVGGGRNVFVYTIDASPPSLPVCAAAFGEPDQRGKKICFALVIHLFLSF